jgi:hypothetical protein
MVLQGLLMQRGKCRLCLKEGDLQESHLLPAAIYKMCRQESGEITDPVGIRNDPKTKRFRVYQSSRQITGYVLCSDCEQILNVNGEDWVLPRLSTLQGFPLHDKLTTVKPEIVDGDVAAYASAKVPDIRTDSVTHFAMGIFWKAGVHNWQTGHGTLRLELGPYQDEMRSFLLGERFPLHAFLMINVVPPSLPTISAYMPYTSKADGFTFHAFYVPGIEFMLTLGKRTPDFLRTMCIASNPARPILVGSFPAQFIGKQFSEAFERGHIPPKLSGRLRRVRGKAGMAHNG